MYLLGVDVGTTHCKAGLFGRDGSLGALAHRPTPTQPTPDGATVYDPDALWATVAEVIRDVAVVATPEQIAAVGVASMAETGVLIERRTGRARTPLIPWFDTQAAPHADQIAQQSDRFERFRATGQRPSFKSALAKVLWLRAQDRALVDGATWLSAADYIVYRLTGCMTTDYTLAVRTYAFRVDQQTWDREWLRDWHLPADLFPGAQPSGVPAGGIVAEHADRLHLLEGTPVAVAGHDHVCAALAVGAIDPRCVFDSMGTAEALIGAVASRPLGRSEYESGLGYGCHVVPDRLYWMGGLSASGGSIEWLRALLGDPPLCYDELLALVAVAGSEPTGILYFPYLLGSGTPHSDPHARGAFVGLRSVHGRAHVAKAVLEGTAYEMEFIRRAAEQGTGTAIDTIVAAGGGTRNRPWMQIKADVIGSPLAVSPVAEATVLGAALVAGIGCGVYRDADDALAATARQPTETFVPDERRNTIYRNLYEQGYLPLQQPLREVSGQLAGAA